MQNLRSFYLVKVAYDFVQQPEALQTLLIDVILVVELPVVGDWGKHHCYVLVFLAVKLLKLKIQQMSLSGFYSLKTIKVFLEPYTIALVKYPGDSLDFKQVVFRNVS